MADTKSNRFGLGWTPITAVGLGAGMVAGLILGGPIAAVVGMMLVTPAVTCLVGGVLGLSQLHHMRSLVARPYQWVVASCVGLGAGLALGVVVVEQGVRVLTGHAMNVARVGVLGRALSFAVVGTISGLLLGVTQSLVLRRSAVRVHGWASATVFALGLGFPLSSLPVDTLLGGVVSPRGVVAFVLLADLFLGAVTLRPLRHAAV